MKNKYVLLIAKVLMALILLAAGSAKLAGVPALHESFQLLGLPGWFGYFIGACEVSGAIGIFVRPLSALAALGIALIMCGALYFHIAHTPLAQGVPALVILLLCLFVFLRTRSDLLKFSND